MTMTGAISSKSVRSLRDDWLAGAWLGLDELVTKKLTTHRTEVRDGDTE
jgi:hypothetical protein